jgi:hypothetical protein
VVLGGSVMYATGYSASSFLLGAIPEDSGVATSMAMATLYWIKAKAAGEETDRYEKVIKNSLKVMIPEKGAFDDTMAILNGDLGKLLSYKDQLKRLQSFGL